MVIDSAAECKVAARVMGKQWGGTVFKRGKHLWEVRVANCKADSTCAQNKKLNVRRVRRGAEFFLGAYARWAQGLHVWAAGLEGLDDWEGQGNSEPHPRSKIRAVSRLFESQPGSSRYVISRFNPLVTRILKDILHFAHPKSTVSVRFLTTGKQLSKQLNNKFRSTSTLPMPLTHQREHPMGQFAVRRSGRTIRRLAD